MSSFSNIYFWLRTTLKIYEAIKLTQDKTGKFVKKVFPYVRYFI